jgi:hypothetical protein
MLINPAARYVLLDERKTRIGLSPRELTLMSLLGLQLLMAWSARIDGTWTLSGAGIGFAEHYGFFTIFLVTPVMLLLTGYILRSFVEAVEAVDSYCTTPSEKTRDWVARLATRHIEGLMLRGESTSILVTTMIIFALLCVYNIAMTIDPVPTYGHDVFDAWAHQCGFFSAKAYVLLALSGVWAMAIFVCLHVTYSMISILEFLRRHDALQVNLFHRDNCGGTSQFGNINLAITCVYFCFLAIVLAMANTHHTTYFVIEAGFIAISLLAIAQTFGAVLAIHRVMTKKKRECLDGIASRINQQVSAASAFPNDLLSYRTHVLALNTFPYARGTLAAVNMLRFAPIVAAVASLTRSLGHS